jgi:hypothetical protein
VKSFTSQRDTKWVENSISGRKNIVSVLDQHLGIPAFRQKKKRRREKREPSSQFCLLVRSKQVATKFSTDEEFPVVRGIVVEAVAKEACV